jgi:hypothetical protein
VLTDAQAEVVHRTQLETSFAHVSIAQRVSYLDTVAEMSAHLHNPAHDRARGDLFSVESGVKGKDENKRKSWRE